MYAKLRVSIKPFLLINRDFYYMYVCICVCRRNENRYNNSII